MTLAEQEATVDALLEIRRGQEPLFAELLMAEPETPASARGKPRLERSVNDK